jgi:exodeoxyribonuclease VII large subunit
MERWTWDDFNEPTSDTDEVWQQFLERLRWEERQASEEFVFTVSQLNEYVRGLISDDPVLQGFWVRGEISRWQVYQSGHAYFTLKDEASQVTGVMWRERLAYLQEMPKVGDIVRVFGSLRVPKGSTQHPRGGEFQIEAERIVKEAQTGVWWQRFEELRQKLQAEGLFDEARKRPLPQFPRRIGIITSLDGAALRDMLRVAQQRHAGVEIVIFPSLVQGDEAPMALVAALQLANSETVRQRIGEIDVLIIGRGGGSMEDLWAFNEECVVRAVAASRIPIVSAVGHEVDFTLTDFAADVRASTPTAAAQMVVPDRQGWLARLEQLTLRLNQAMRHWLRSATERWRRLAERRCFTDPTSLFADRRQLLDLLTLQLDKAFGRNLARWQECLNEWQRRLLAASPTAQLERWRERLGRYDDALRAAAQKALQRRQQTLQVFAAKLEALSPYAVLQRGYALVRDPATGRVVTRSAHLTKGQIAEVLMADGQLQVTVNEVVTKDGKDAANL